MSDTTPRPDETPGDPTAPAQPADLEVTEVVTTTQDAGPAPETAPQVPTPEPAFAPPAPQQPPPPPPPPAYEQPQYAQQELPPPPPPQYPAPGTAVVGPNPLSPTEERTWGMGAHGVALAATVLSGGFLGFVAALVMYLIFRDRGPFVRYNTANALNVQIIAGIVMLVSLPLMLVLVGFLTFAAAWVFAVVVHIVGMVKANNGEWWNPPMTPQFVK